MRPGSRIFQISVPVPDPANFEWDPGDPVPDADPWLRGEGRFKVQGEGVYKVQEGVYKIQGFESFSEKGCL